MICAVVPRGFHGLPFGMGVDLLLSGYDISDEGPARTVNEDATLVREDLGLFAVADGAGGRGLGDVAANLALRSIENYIGATVRRSHERPDYDLLGTPEQARRLSSAVHQAHQNVLQIASEDKSRQGMASTVVALLLAPRTKQAHIAHVGNSRCYRLRHGRLELLTVDHTISTEILERRPNTPDRVLENLPRNSIVSALGMDQPLRVPLRSVDLIPGDRFVLCTDGLTSAVDTATIWLTARELDSASVIASELLGHALAARTQDNVSILIVDCHETLESLDLETQRYNEIPLPPDEEEEILKHEERPGDALEPLFDDAGGLAIDGPVHEAIERWSRDSEPPTVPHEKAEQSDKPNSTRTPREPPASSPFLLDELDLELEEFPPSEPPEAQNSPNDSPPAEVLSPEDEKSE